MVDKLGSPRGSAPRNRIRRVGLAVALAVTVTALVGASPVAGPPHNQVAVLHLTQTPSTVAVGVGATWVSEGGEGLFTTLARVNPKTNRVVKTFTVAQGILSLAAGDGAVWVANSESGTVYRVNPTSGTIVSSDLLGSGGVGEIAVGGGAVWATVSDPNTSVVRVDPATVRSTASADLGPATSWVAVGGGGVWVVNPQVGAVVRLDPATGGIVTSIPVQNPDQVAVGAGGVWVTDPQDGTVLRIDPSTNRVIATAVTPGIEGGIAIAGGAPWVNNTGTDTVLRIDPSTTQTTQTIRLGGTPNTLAGTATALWVTDGTNNTLTRIGVHASS
jgi:streptogramin lyase